jgi:hypothetical protein
MRIVVFNSPMIYLSGGQVNARDWTLGLKARGHKVTLFALVAGPLAEEVRQAGVSVISDPALMADKPDVLFGYGLNDLIALIARFPDVPAVQVSQQWSHWEHFPCPLPQVVLHVAVDDINAEMLVNEFGIAREQVRLIYNAVDMSRLSGRAPTSQSPRGNCQYRSCHRYRANRNRRGSWRCCCSCRGPTRHGGISNNGDLATFSCQ